MAISAKIRHWVHMHTGSIREGHAAPSDLWTEVQFDEALKKWVSVPQEKTEPTAFANAATAIKGYRQLSQMELDLINMVKEHAESTRVLIESLDKAQADNLADPEGVNFHLDVRWLAIARTELQKGYMFLVRSIAKPETF